jgi:chromosome segregation ATPase
MSYREKKRTAADLVHRKNRDQKKREPEESSSLNSIVDSFAASLFGKTVTPAAPEAVPPEEPVAEVEPPPPESEFFDTDADELTYDEPDYVEEPEPEVESEHEYNEPEVATAVEPEYEDFDEQETNEAAINDLDAQQRQIAAQENAIRQQSAEADSLAAEKLTEQRSAIDQLTQNIEQGRTAVEALRQQARESHAAAVQEFEQNNTTLQSLIAERNSLASDFEQQKLELQNQSQAQSAHLESIVEQIGIERAALEERKTDFQQASEPAIDPADVELRRAELQSVQAERKQLEAEIAEAEALAETHQNEAVAAYESLQQEVEQQKSLLAARREALASIKSQPVPQVDSSLEAEVRQLTEEAEIVEAEIRKHEQNRDNAKDELVEKESGLVRQRDTLQAKITKAKDKLQAMSVPAVSQEDIATREAEIESLHTDFFRVKAAIAEANNLVQNQQDAAAQARLEHEQAVADWTRQLNEQTAILANLQQQPTPTIDLALNTEIGELQRKADTVKAQVEEARSQLFASTASRDQQQMQLVEQRDALRQSLEADELELEKLHQSLPATAAATSEELEAEIDQLHARSKSLDQKIEQVRQQHEEATAAADEVAVRQAQQQEQCAKLRAEIDARTETLWQLENQPTVEDATALDSEIASLNEQSAELAGEIERLKAQHAAAEAESANRGTLLSEKREGLLFSLNQQRERLSALHQTGNVEAVESPALQNEVDGLVAEAAQLEAQIAKLRQHVETRDRESEKERDRLKKRIKKLKKKIAEDTQAITELGTADTTDSVGEELRTEVEKLNAESASLQSRLRSRTAERDEIRTALAEEYEALTEQKSLLHEEIESGKAAIENLESDPPEDSSLLQLREEVTQLQAESESVVKTREGLASERESQQANRDELNQRIAELSAKLDAERQQLAAISEETPQGSLEDEQQQIQQLTESLEQTRIELADRTEKAAAIQEQVETQRSAFQQQREELQREIDATRQQLASVNEPSQPSPADLEIRKAELLALSNERDELVVRVEAAKEAARSASEEQVQQQQSQLDSLRHEIDSSRQALAHLPNHDSPANEVSEFEQQVKELQSEADAIRQQLSEANEKAAASRRESEQQLSSLTQTRDALQQRIDTDRSELQELTTAIQQTQVPTNEQLEPLEAERDELAAKIEAARQELAEAHEAAAEVKRREEAKSIQLRQEVAAEKQQFQAIADQVKALRKRSETTNPELQALVEDREQSQLRLAKAKQIHAEELQAQKDADARARAEAARLQVQLAEDALQVQKDQAITPPSKLAPFLPVGGRPVSAAEKMRVRPTSEMNSEVDSEAADSVGTQAGRSEVRSAKAKSKTRSGKPRFDMSPMKVVWCGLLTQVGTFAAFAIGCCIYLALPSVGEPPQLWTSFLNSARWILPVTWIGGMGLCCVVPKRTEGRGVCIAATVLAAAISVATLAYWAGQGDWFWVFVSLAAIFHAYFFESFLAEVAAYGKFKATEDQCELLISATTLTLMLLLVTGVCWFFEFSETLVSGLLLANVVTFGLIAAAICAMAFRLTSLGYKELKKGRW